MNRLHIFNSSNDLALASDTREYIPPRNIQRMERELSPLPIWWCEDGDAVIIDNEQLIEASEEITKSTRKRIYLTSLSEGYTSLCRRSGNRFTPAPWGWSKAIVEKFRRFGIPATELPDEKQLGTMRMLSGKRYAVTYLQDFLAEATAEDKINKFVGEKMRFIDNLEQFEISERTILKSLWSSSGRGVFATDSLNAPSILEKLSGFLKRQHGFIADRLYDKKLDFALEYSIDNCGKVTFLGYSIFSAADNGYYGYNIIASQETLRSMILESGIDADTIVWTIEKHAELINKHFSGRYKGTLGIDMLVTEENKIIKLHPCIEINLRMNLGIAAMHIFEANGERDILLTPDIRQGFIAAIENKRLMIKARQ